MLSRIFNPAAEPLEDRAISFQTIFGSGGDLMVTTPAGVTMNQDESMKLATVYACVRLIADSISTLPVDTFIRRDGTRTPFRPRPEWLDMPEVALVAILDADKEGFLRSATSLIQTIGRCARNVNAQVLLYADTVTPAMRFSCV